jgi:hypothetical protein
MPEAVLQEGERKVTGASKHNHTGEPYFETVVIPPVDAESESEQKVVEQGEGYTSSNTVC